MTTAPATIWNCPQSLRIFPETSCRAARASGEPYLVHPLGSRASPGGNEDGSGGRSLSGLLHDSVEDTSVTIVDIRKEFGEQVAHIVEGVTKISKIDFATREEQQAENLRKMMLAMVDDIRVVLIKLADRLHNMRTLEHLPPERQQKIAKETLEIYGPIAHRLGMGKFAASSKIWDSAISIR